MNADPHVSPSDSLSKSEIDHSIRRGTRAVIATQILAQIFSLIVLAVAYRLISQQDFGVLGMVVPLMMLLRILATQGLNVATVQEAKLTDGQLSSLFWSNLALATFAGLATAACGPWLAILFKTPQVAPVSFALAGTAVVAGLGSQHQAIMERGLALSSLAIIRLIGLLCGGVTAIVLACLNQGIWALVVQQYIELLVIAVLVWAVHPWRPTWPWRGDAIGGLLKFGGYYSMSNIMFYISRNTDKWLLSILLGSTAEGRAIVGMYTQAFNQMMKPVFLLTTPLASVMLPGLSRAKNDIASFRELATRFYRLIAVAIFPVAIGLFIVSADAFEILGGPQWRTAGVMLSALSLTVLAQGLINISGSLLAAKGRADFLFVASVVTAVILTIGCWAGYSIAIRSGGGPIAGAIGMAWSYSIVSVCVLCIPYLLACFRIVDLPAAAIFRSLMPSLLPALAMGIVVGCCSAWLQTFESLPITFRLAATVTVGVVVYFILARGEIRQSWQTLSHKR